MSGLQVRRGVGSRYAGPRTRDRALGELQFLLLVLLLWYRRCDRALSPICAALSRENRPWLCLAGVRRNRCPVRALLAHARGGRRRLRAYVERQRRRPERPTWPHMQSTWRCTLAFAIRRHGNTRIKPYYAHTYASNSLPRLAQWAQVSTSAVRVLDCWRIRS